MKKLLAIAMLSIIVLTHRANAQEKCLSEIMFQEQAKTNPDMLKTRQNLDSWVQEYVKKKKEGLYRFSSPGSATASFVIPIVFHVIHNGGPENISREQILDQVRIINEDYRRLNADTANTLAQFKPIAADADIEFQLAQLDPLGNCTDGITRYYSPLTYNARDNVKALVDWPRDRYLNIWVVSSIANTNGSPGTVIGFAQFPGGAASTDGVVLASNYVGSIGTSLGHSVGRTATHEIGHYLNLRHIWGDEPLCANDDGISDTPLQADKTFSTCPTGVQTDGCSPNSPGFLYQDYMDYTDDACMNVFTQGQVDAMQNTLINSISSRDNLWQTPNLTLTGTDGVTPIACNVGVKPVADFASDPIFICQNNTINFKDFSWGGAAISRLWTFAGGTPATDTSSNPSVLYSTPGVYDVTLTLTNGAGSDTKTFTGLITVFANAAPQLIPFSEGFESGSFPFNDWFTANLNGNDTWEVTSNAAQAGTKSLYIHNFSGINDKGPDDFILPAMDFTNVTAISMSFDLAFAFKSTLNSNTDKLAISYSKDCGQTWSVRRTLTGSTFPTTTSTVGGNFVPNSSQWRNEVVSTLSIPTSGQPNIRFRFSFTHDTGNNIYIDNINITGTVGINEVNAQHSSVNVYPNPSSSSTYVDFKTVAAGHVKYDVIDGRGRIIETYENEMPAGDHQYKINENLEKGVYMVRLSFGDNIITKKVVIE